MFKAEQIEESWLPVLDSPDAPAFMNDTRRAITTVLLENQRKALTEERGNSSMNESTTVGGGAIQNWDPVLISLVRRAMPNVIAYDIASVQPMTMPTGLIFAMRSEYQIDTAGVISNDREALFNKPSTAFSGKVTTAEGEALTGNSVHASGNTVAGGGFGNMSFTIDKTSVTARTRALKAEYTMEIAQDLKSVHGADAESELANILSTEIVSEINREIIDTVNVKAVNGGVITGTGTVAGATNVPLGTGSFNIHTDADGRWMLERFKSLLFQVELDANAVAKTTRRGKGNYMLCSSNVASALAASGVLDYAPAMSTNLNVDDTGNVFAGVLSGRIKVYIDPFAAFDYITVGYRGTNIYDAGLFYCPYVPLTMVRAVDPQSFQPKIGFKTRYGLVCNPFAAGATSSELGTDGGNPYFRTFAVVGIV